MRGLGRMVLAWVALALLPGLAWGSVSVTVNGTSYTIPQTNERNWGTNVTSWIQAISSNTLQPSGGNFTLTADTDFGATYGLKSTYYKSRTANVSSVGQFRLANTDTICFRNNANSADLCLGPNTGTNGVVQFNGVDLVGTTLTQTLTNKSISGATNTFSSIPNSATTATNLNTNSSIVSRDGSGNFSAGTITATLSGNATNVSGVVALVNGGTGTAAASAAAALNALLPTQTANSGKYLTTDATNASWATVSATNTYLAKSADYTLLVSDQTVGFDATGANRTATLPTAVGNSGLILKVLKSDTSTNTVTVATTSAQTIGGRASSAIVLRRPQDFLMAQSDGTNWQILDKREYEVVTSAASVTFSTTSATNYYTGANSVSLSYGLWEVTASMGVNFASGSNIGVMSETGFYGADGANSASTPTALGGTISGFTNYGSVQPSYVIGPGTFGTNARVRGPTLKILAQFTSTTTVYLVPRLDFGTASTATFYGEITARRLF